MKTLTFGYDIKSLTFTFTVNYESYFLKIKKTKIALINTNSSRRLWLRKS